MTLNKEWVTIEDRASHEYVKGVDHFLNFAFSSVLVSDANATIRCPCDKCRNINLRKRIEVRFDLLKFGMYKYYTIWDLHGEQRAQSVSNNTSDDDDSVVNMIEDACGVAGMQLEMDVSNHTQSHEQPNGEALKFYRLLKEYEEPLVVEDTTMSKLSYIVKLLHLKVLNNWTDSSMDNLLKLQIKLWL